MYKLIFADDELLIRNNMMKGIHWEEHGFQVIGCYSNGDELLDALGAGLPDLVITDINMPYVDGIQVAKYLHYNHPRIKVIFLTGYNEFEYAKNAMEYGVSRYILKPISSEDIYQLLDETKALLDRENKDLDNRMKLEEFYEANQPILKNMLVSQILAGKIGLKEIQARARMLKMEILRSPAFQVACIQADSLSEDDAEGAEQRGVQVFRRMQRLLEEKQLGFAIMDHLGCSVLFCLGEKGEGYSREDLEVFLEEFRGWFEQHEDFTVTIGIGGCCESLELAANSYGDAAGALKYQGLVGTNRLIYLEDMEPYRDMLYQVPEGYAEKILNMIKIGDSRGLKSVMGEYREWLRNSGSEMDVLRLRVVDTAVNVSEEVLRMGYEIKDILYGENLRRLVGARGIDELAHNLFVFCRELTEKVSRFRSTHYDEIVREAKALVEEHYRDADFQIEDVCQQLNLSVSYFRAIFKKETGHAFGTYLKGIRMKKAKKLLLETDLLNYQIAEKVGYNDSSYFGYCFKQHYQMSPNDMRRRKAADGTA